MGITMHTAGISEAARAIDHEVAAVGAKAEALEARGAQQVLANIKERAPRGTGDYIASWRSEGNEVGTDSAQAHRLEAGFHQADSLGRRYDQDPFPHVGPAVDVFEERFPDEIAVAITASQINP